MLRGIFNFRSFNHQTQDVKKYIEDKNIFEDIAHQISKFIIIETNVIPTDGKAINEGDEFTLRVIFGII